MPLRLAPSYPPEMPFSKTRRAYPTDLSDREWEVLKPLVPQAKVGGARPRAHESREILDAIFFYVLRSGCPWRLLPHESPPWQTAYHYFRAWRRIDGTWERVHDALRERVRVRSGREATPSAAIIDSQSAKTTEKGGTAATMAGRRR